MEDQDYSYTPLISREGLEDSNFEEDEDHDKASNLDQGNLHTSSSVGTHSAVNEEEEDTQTTPLHANMTDEFFHHSDDRFNTWPSFPRNKNSRFSHSSSIAATWNAITHKHSRFILSLFLIIVVAGIYSMPLFTQYTDSTFHPVPNSLSAEAVEVCCCF